jgi:hypothetical protein
VNKKLADAITQWEATKQAATWVPMPYAKRFMKAARRLEAVVMIPNRPDQKKAELLLDLQALASIPAGFIDRVHRTGIQLKNAKRGRIARSGYAKGSRVIDKVVATAATDFWRRKPKFKNNPHGTAAKIHQDVERSLGRSLSQDALRKRIAKLFP